MKVTLISYTPDALALLLFTKATRLAMSPGLLAEIRAWPEERKAEELAYMLGTIRSSWEFVDYVFFIEDVTRGFTHQLVRHRVGVSFAQQTQRAVHMGGFRYGTGASVEAAGMLFEYQATMMNIDDSYQAMIRKGVKPQDARGVLPTNIFTNIIMKINLRALNGMMAERLCVKAQGEFQEVARLLRVATIAAHPWAAPFLRVHCAATGTCLFANLPMEECPVKPLTYDPATREAYGGGRPGSLGAIEERWETMRAEVQPQPPSRPLPPPSAGTELVRAARDASGLSEAPSASPGAVEEPTP